MISNTTIKKVGNDNSFVSDASSQKRGTTKPEEKGTFAFQRKQKEITVNNLDSRVQKSNTSVGGSSRSRPSSQ